MLGFGLGLNKWRRVGGGYVGLLDLFPNAAAAYSLRKLRAAYSGAAVRVRESGGNTEADIGFTSAGELDTSALLAHCGANDGFVTVWYDQSLSNDATQSTAADQPKIVSGGSLVTEGSKPAIEFDGVDDFIVSSTGGLPTENNFLITSVAKYTNNDIQDVGWRIASSVADPRLTLLVNSNDFEFEDSTNDYTISGLSKLSVQSISSIVYNPSGTSYYYADGVEEGNVDTSLIITGENFGDDLYLGSRWGGNYNTECLFQEFIIYPSDQSANRTAIEANINNFYSIYP